MESTSNSQAAINGSTVSGSKLDDSTVKSSLNSFPVPSAVEDWDEDDAEEEIHRDEDVSIKVTQRKGFLCHIEATAAFRLPAHTLFRQIITHPDNAAVFRHMDRCAYRRVLRDDGRGRRSVRVAHEASWRLLLFHGTFTTKLLVEEDERELTMAFELDAEGGGSGVMKKFHGRWKIRPHPADPQRASISMLEQDLALAIYMPPPLDSLLKRICCSQVRKIFEDVKREADNINRGKPTLRPWDEVQDKAFGEEQVQLRDDSGGKEAPSGVPSDAGVPAGTAAAVAEPGVAPQSADTLPAGAGQ